METKEKLHKFYDLKVWRDGHSLTLAIYKETAAFPRDEVFGLISQMRRSSSSITANIAEGFGRFFFKEKIKFYQQARGSAVELQNHILLARDLSYIPQETAWTLFANTDIVLKEINGLIQSVHKFISKSSS